MQECGLWYTPVRRNEFTAIIEQAEGWFIAYSPEMPGANGQGRTKDEAVTSLGAAIELILEDRCEKWRRVCEGEEMNLGTVV